MAHICLPLANVGLMPPPGTGFPVFVPAFSKGGTIVAPVEATPHRGGAQPGVRDQTSPFCSAEGLRSRRRSAQYRFPVPSRATLGFPCDNRPRKTDYESSSPPSTFVG